MKSCRLILAISIIIFLGNIPASAQHSKKPDAVKPSVTSIKLDSPATLQFEKFLKDDVIDHRTYIESIDTNFLHWLLIICSICGVITAFFGWRSWKQLEKTTLKKLTKMFNEKSKTQLDNLWSAKSAEMDISMKSFEKELAKESENQIKKASKKINEHISTIQETMELQRQELRVMSIYSNIIIKREQQFHIPVSKTYLEYLDTSGNQVFYRKTQEMNCIANEAVSETSEVMYANAPGKIANIEVSGPSQINESKENDFYVILPFNPPLKKGDAPYHKNISCKFLNTFTGQKEWFYVYQTVECEEEIFEIKFLKGRVCKKIYAEKIGEVGHVLETNTDKDFERFTEGGFDMFTIKFPKQIPPYKYKITWEF